MGIIFWFIVMATPASFCDGFTLSQLLATLIKNWPPGTLGAHPMRVATSWRGPCGRSNGRQSPHHFLFLGIPACLVVGLRSNAWVLAKKRWVGRIYDTSMALVNNSLSILALSSLCHGAFQMEKLRNSGGLPNLHLTFREQERKRYYLKQLICQVFFPLVLTAWSSLQD